MGRRAARPRGGGPRDASVALLPGGPVTALEGLLPRAACLALRPAPPFWPPPSGSVALALLGAGLGPRARGGGRLLPGRRVRGRGGGGRRLLRPRGLRGDPARRRLALGLALVLALPHLASLRAFSSPRLRTAVWEAVGRQALAPGRSRAHGARMPRPCGPWPGFGPTPSRWLGSARRPRAPQPRSCPRWPIGALVPAGGPARVSRGGVPLTGAPLSLPACWPLGPHAAPVVPFRGAVRPLPPGRVPRWTRARARGRKSRCSRHIL